VQVVLEDVRYPIFQALLEYVYTDSLQVDLDEFAVMELFQARPGHAHTHVTHTHTHTHVMAYHHTHLIIAPPPCQWQVSRKQALRLDV
jgi:hypothetical protein